MMCHQGGVGLRRVLGFDFGYRRIGTAVGQLITRTASPLTALAAKDGVPDWQLVANLIKEWQPNVLAVGYPLNMDGSDQVIGLAAKSFSRKLYHRFALKTVLVDERLTTKEARALLREQRIRFKDNASGVVDSVAAVLIVEQWLNQLSS